ncbi:MULTISPECIES: Lacal_2735 family protein [Mesoflavibacter]|uniref:Lacal_2735 family protein n=1 Tax=Mesoflavibacter profundi TaxID=2708110 RepID=A0ABT4RWH1_9FLAO|nr:MULTISPECIES: Lacal_2735 family protein [Mesoflavibacter]MDA0175963.1 Lacal_2735 family protein [Mesoflavibacter profundi]QIJ89592.1 hypothetical protein C7H62_1783 [Mesoflavibacter sp. HG96]QIJ92320.1 hypothetical protein C7H56_1783 [Mesoflavibacter sp. HG37]
MSRRDLLKQQQLKLNKRYKQLVEEAYNLRQTNHEESDMSEFRAIKILDKLNKLKFLVRDTSQSMS